MTYALRTLTPSEAAGHLAHFSDLLIDAVQGGAGVNFMADVTRADVDAYWQNQIMGFASNDRIWLVAEVESRIVGMVMCVFAPQPNQPYRAEISKMLVHSSHRNKGVGAALMQRIEAEALKAGKVLLVLDTVTESAGDRLYRRMGWTAFGTVPGFAYLPDGTPQAATFFMKQLAAIPAWFGMTRFQ
jgi:GNAT superfamily N-acetyltransferase